MLENPMIEAVILDEFEICDQCKMEIYKGSSFYLLENVKPIHKDCGMVYTEEMKKYEAFKEWIENNLKTTIADYFDICDQCKMEIYKGDSICLLENGEPIHEECDMAYVEDMKKPEAFDEWIENNLVEG